MQEQCRLITKEQLDYYKGLEKKLAIAVDALKQYAKQSEWTTGYDEEGNGGEKCMYLVDGYETAEKALQQIEELSKRN